jgi:PAS domain S-box-containing protein
MPDGDADREVTGPSPAEMAALRLAAIVRDSDDAIVSKDLTGVITSWNPAAERMFGYTAGEAVGRSITLIIPPDRRHEEDMVLRRLCAGESVDHFETVRVRKDGTFLDISITVSPIRNAAGRIIGASKIARDITERKAAERERAILLAREQAARAQAEAANRIKDEFLAVLSHELRTPLTSAHGWTRLLQTQPFDQARLQKALDVIRRSIDMQLRLVNDLLDISALAVGKIELERRRVNLADVVRGTVETLKRTAGTRNIDLVEVIEPTGLVDADPARLEQIVGNLVGNALKFTDAGGRVEVRVGPVGGEAQIAVTDTGRGIEPAFLPFVFDKFRQAESSTTRQVGGLGLGLAIVRSLVELHGGRVWADSPGPGKGATFTVRLPLAANAGDSRR